MKQKSLTAASLLLLALVFSISCTPYSDTPSFGYSKFFGQTDDETLLASAQRSTGNRVHWVEIKGMHFDPENIETSRGDTIVWINKDIFAHDVTEFHSKKWSSSKMEPGTSWAMIANDPAEYFCSIHVVMKGKIIMKDIPLSQK